MIRGAVSRLRDRLRWWYAKRFGREPICDVCGEHQATWYATDRGYLCLSCDYSHRPTSAVAAVRDIEPRDWLEDNAGWEE
jgi:tRNA(Ile2) C34 agmatinyltransferase TiaS